MAAEPKNVSNAQQWVDKIVGYIEKCEESQQCVYSEVAHFQGCSYPSIWENAVCTIWDDITTTLGLQSGVFGILRTDSSEVGRTGARKNQHILALRNIGDSPGQVWDGRGWADFSPPKIFTCPESAYVKGNIEFFVVGDGQ